MSHNIISTLWIETWEDVLEFMQNTSDEQFAELGKNIFFNGEENNYLYEINNNVYLAFIVWLIIVRFSELNKDVYPFVKHLHRILGGIGISQEEFWITKERVNYFLLPNQKREAIRNWKLSVSWSEKSINSLEKFRKSERHLRIIWNTLSDIWVSESDVEVFLESQAPFLLEEALQVLPNLVWYASEDILEASISHIQFLLEKSGKTIEQLGFPNDWDKAILQSPKKEWIPREVLQIQARRHLINHGMLDVRTRVEEITNGDIEKYLSHREDFRTPTPYNLSW